ncbi:MAG: M48 family metallopeptidase [Mariniblastus sp.]|nr:M48 family metallopeptidase [Mariniblastus sp.]
MDFFAAQELRRRKTKWLVLLYGFAILLIVLGIYTVISVALGFAEPTRGVEGFFDPVLFAIVAVVNVLVIGGASFYKTAELRSGGQQVASMMGGTRIPASTTDLAERRLLNVVEEMALASGVSVPPVYVMNHEPGINAFAAGYSPADAVIGVNRGTIEQLNRDELQGVIAHEFSHILNGDMRMNIRLIGILFGIQMLAMIGYFLLRAFGTRGRRSSGDDAKGAAAIMAIAMAFLVFGSIGQVFARLIKASISRQREYLADASAVQFTRYPEGLAGALKIIGSSATGSAVLSDEAESLSHMYFAKCFSSKLSGFLSTHPPLVPRIQKIEPKFDGDFQGYDKARKTMAAARAKRIEREKKKQKTEPFTPIGKMFPQEIAEKFSVDPAFLLAAIGSPNLKDVQRSRELIGELPDEISSAAHHPYSARCVAFATLLSDDGTMRQQQLSLIRNSEGQATFDSTMKLIPVIEELHLVYRLPMLEMIQGSLSDLSHPQYSQFRRTVESLVRLDNKTSLFEFVVRHHLLMHLDRRFAVQRPPRVRYKSTKSLAQEIELMLSAFASASVTGSVLDGSVPPEIEDVERSYRLAMQVAGFGDAAESNAKLKPWEVEQLEACMQRLQMSSPAVKKQFLEAAAVLITFDHEITISEAEFFRAVAESLDCPVPVFAAGYIKQVTKDDPS